MATAIKIPYNLIHTIEHKYGSLVKAPADDPNLLKIHKKIGIAEKNKAQKTVTEKYIIGLIKKGWRPKEICQNNKISKNRVNLIKSKNFLTYKPMFKYRISKKGERNIFITGLSESVVITHMKNTNLKETRKYLKDLGYRLIKRKYHWHDLNSGDRYIDKNKKMLIKP